MGVWSKRANGCGARLLSSEPAGCAPPCSGTAALHTHPCSGGSSAAGRLPAVKTFAVSPLWPLRAGSRGLGGESSCSLWRTASSSKLGSRCRHVASGVLAAGPPLPLLRTIRLRNREYETRWASFGPSYFEGPLILKGSLEAQLPVLPQLSSQTSAEAGELHAGAPARLGSLGLPASSSSKMEALGGYPSKSSSPKAKLLAVLLSVTVGVGCLLLLRTQLRPRTPADFYSFEVKDAKGRTVSLEKYRGKASLVVNVASRSERTQESYASLQELHRELGTSHFNVLAFPCGQFGDTETGTSSRDIEAVAKSAHGVTFPFFGRIKILGSEADPAFKFLTDSVQKTPKWNFWKFLVNPEGRVIRFWRTDESAESVRREATALVREIILKKRVEL